MRHELFRVFLLCVVAIILPFCLVEGQALAQTTTTGATVTTTGPVTSETTVSIGTLAGEALKWTITAFGVPIGALVTGWLWTVLKRTGFQLDEDYRARLQELVVNGLNALGRTGAGAAQGKMPVTMNSPMALALVEYAKEHGPGVVKALAKDPNSTSFQEAIVGRANRALNDPLVPTPAAITPDIGLPKAVVVQAVLPTGKK